MKNPFLDDTEQAAAPRNPFLDESTTVPPQAWADVAGQAGQNIVPSAKRFGTDIVGVVTDPVGALKNVARLGVGGVEKLIPGEQGHEKYANAVGQFFAERYGGMDALKKTIAEDPVGFAADVGTLLSGGELALARAPGIVGEIGRAAGTVGRAIDPVNAAVKGAGLVAKGVGLVAATGAGVTTGVGGQAIRTAAKTGYEGGEAGQAFRDAMRGNTPMDDVVTEARSAIGNIKQERQAAYKSGMTDLSKDQTVLDFGKIDATLAGTKPVASFKGISLNPSANATVQELSKVLDQWRKLDPKEFHTAEGFDALKQRIGDIVDNTERGSPAQKIATQVYNVVRDQIVKQAPDYAKTMKGYHDASNLIREMEKTLSLNPKASINTSLKKLQSVMRDNVNTNYGKRADLVKLLQESGAEHLLAKLAGQSLKSIEPRGLARIVASAGTLGTGGLAVMGASPLGVLAAAGGLAAQSPRIVGELAHASGRIANKLSRSRVRNALLAGYQTRGASQ